MSLATARSIHRSATEFQVKHAEFFVNPPNLLQDVRALETIARGVEQFIPPLFQPRDLPLGDCLGFGGGHDDIAVPAQVLDVDSY